MMGKKSSKRNKKKKRSISTKSILYSEMRSDGYHAFIAGERPSQSELDKMTAEYRANIRKSPLWQEMIKQYGEKKAEELLQEFNVELRP